MRDTLVILIFKSDGTQFMDFACEKTELSVYTTNDNLSLDIGQMPSMHSVIMGGLLPIPIKNNNISQ